MDGFWGFNRFKLKIAILLLWCFLYQNLDCCWSLNAEGLALLRFREKIVSDPYGALSSWNRNDVEDHPCSWFGVECSQGKVVILNLKDLCLEGTLTPGLGMLVHVRSIVLRNNSFYGSIPKEIGELKELEMLDLGYNDFSGPLPSNLGNNLSLAILLLDNNKFLDSTSSELHELSVLSELQVDENLLSNAVHGASCNRRYITLNNVQDEDVAHRRLLQTVNTSPPQRAKTDRSKTGQATRSESSPSHAPAFSPSPSPSPSSSPLLSPVYFSSPSPSPSPSSLFSPSDSPIFLPPELSPAPSPLMPPSPAPAGPPSFISAPPPSYSAPLPSSPAFPSQPNEVSSRSKSRLHWPILSGSIGGSFILISVIGLLLCRSNKVVTVKPWATGLSGQLQKAFITGAPKLKRSELETACEDFSNIIDSFPNGKVYKGTLSSGVEIAVTSAKDWSKQLEAQFRKKIDTLSKVNHKNFLNLLGFCEEEEPFTRMMVFEYAPNGTLFEHLHIKEAEHLDWGARLRIAMGMAYCLEHMYQLTPPVTHSNLQSSCVYLTEDYAAKLSDHGFFNEAAAAAKTDSTDAELLDGQSPNTESAIYSFGVILLEIVTGRLPYSKSDRPLEEWASEYLRGEKPVKEMVDPTLKSFKEEQVKKLCEVITSCIHNDPKQRPSIRDVTARMREITEMAPDGATPKLSPLWWAELEILSTEAV